MNHVLKDFYTIQNLDAQEGSITATILLDPDHAIYNGHFPEQPVVPGVCQMQLTKEIVCEALGKNLSIVSAQNMKFMAVIDPTKNNLLTVNINFQLENEDQIKIDSSISFDTTTCFKFSGRYKTTIEC